MEERHRASYGEGQGVSMLSEGATLPKLHVFTNPEALRTQFF